MPRYLLVGFAAAALAIAACHGSTPSTPTAPSSSPTPNPSITMASILVTVNGTPQPKVPVEISTPASTSSPRPGKPFFTEKTGKKGYAKFRGLTPSQMYCWVALISPSFYASDCAPWEIWQSGPITLGN